MTTNLKQISIICFLLLNYNSSGSAQIVPDTTLPNNSVVIAESNTLRIEGGSTAGGNLFHSFREFSLPTGKEAFFNNTIDIQNIFSRVTGSNISNIDGLIRANGTANLFLINPNGIIFGINAKLNIGGSFFGTTANSIKFSDRTEFSATNPTASLLTINIPIGLQFGANPGAIQVLGTGSNIIVGEPVTRDSSFTPSGLGVQPEQTLALVGGDITLEGSTLTAPGGRIELGSVSNGEISLRQNPNWSLDYQGITNFRDIRLSQKAAIDASGVGNSSIQVVGRQISLTGGGFILIQNQGKTPSGTITINASESIEVSGSSQQGTVRSGIFSENLADSKAADIAIATGRLVLLDGGKIDQRTFSFAPAGNLIINASDSVELIVSSIFEPLRSNNASNIGNSTFAEGNAGDINITTQRLMLQNGGVIGANTFKNGNGNAGNITINAANSVELYGANLITSLVSNINTKSFNGGNAGTVIINTSRLVAYDGGNISSSTLVSGKAGDVTINANLVEISGSVPFGSSISSAALINPPLRKLFDLPPLVTGESGNVTVNTAVLVVKDGGQVTVRNEGPGNAGILTINANLIFLDREGVIGASTTSGEGGNIFLQTQNLQLRNQSRINATAEGNGNGGNISINANTINALENSDITANSVAQQGGRITISSQGIFGTQYRLSETSLSDITATGGTPALNGIVQINTPDVNPASGLIELAANFSDLNNQITPACPASGGNSFTITGRGGLPVNPTENFIGQIFWHDWGLLPSQDRIGERGDPQTPIVIGKNETYQLPISSNQPEIIEVTGWQINRNGEVELVANQQRTASSGWDNTPSCGL